MKKRNVGIAVVVVAAAGIWFGRLAWRAHHHRVTLQARNMPLADVVRSLEQQTWEKIRYDKGLHAKITLNVRDALLEDVLDLVADRAGARWQKTFAVGAGGDAMARLEPALAGEVKLEAAGWTNVAPRMMDEPHEQTIGGGPIPVMKEDPKEVSPPEDGGPGGRQVVHQFVVAGGPPEAGAVRAVGERGNGGMPRPAATQIIMMDSNGTIDRWSSEEIVLETDLVARAGKEIPSEVSAETAQRLASAVRGKSVLYYHLAPAPFGMTGPGPGPGLRHVRGPGMPARGPESGVEPGPGPMDGDIVGSIMMAQRQRRLSELSRSPEEQVERARQASTNNVKMSTFRFEPKEK